MSAKPARNPGPPGGYRVIRGFHKFLPRPLFNAALTAGSAVAAVLMPEQRRHSKEYLRLVLGREPRARDVWRHFNSFSESLVARLLQGAGYTLRRPEGMGEEFLALVESGAQVLYGTFHMGCADIIGFQLSRSPRSIHMVRLKVGNSHDTERLMESYGAVRLIWVNQPGEMITGIKEALDGGGSLALQCDRPEFASKRENFRFLGIERPFPTTIYHLSALYGLPVAFCFSFLEENGVVASHAPAVFHPRPGAPKREVVAAGHAHFQQVLNEVEVLLRKHPYQWFNFGPMIPLQKEPGR